MRVDTTYNVHGMPWNINPENMNLLLKRDSTGQGYLGDPTPLTPRVLVRAKVLYHSLTTRAEACSPWAPKSLPWPRRGKVVLAKLGKTVECGKKNWSHTRSQWSESNDQPLECPWMTIQLWSRIPPRYRNSRIPRILVLDFSCILKSSTSLAPFQKAYVQYRDCNVVTTIIKPSQKSPWIAMNLSWLNN